MAFDLFILILIGIALLVGKAGREQLAEANAAPYATRRTINGLTILAFVMFMLGVLMMFVRGIMILGGGCGGNEGPARQAKRPVPVQAPPIVPVTDPRLKVRQVTTSRGRSGFEQSTCAVMNTGGVKCWGRNDHGLIAIGYYVPVPVDVQNTSDVAAVYLGDSHACALTKNGRVKCWGAHSAGRLGNGSDKDSTVPTIVPGLSGVKAISVGLSHTCAVTNANRVKCWGDNEAHQVGIGPIGIGPTRGPEYDSDTWWRLPVPVPVPGLSGIAAVAAGDRHTCALAKTGKVKCWGSFRLWGREDPSEDVEDVVEIPGLDDVTAIAAGSNHTCALTKVGAVECWGKNDEGELGDGSTTESDIPGDVFGLSEIIAISAGSTASCALTRAGRVKCWGEISTLTGTGDGTNERHLTPIEIPSLSDAVSVSVGGTHACALTSGGAVVCWGDNMSGQLGNGTSTFVSLVPIQVKF